MYRGSRARGRGRASYHAHFSRDANTHLSRYEKSRSPHYTVSRRPRSRSPPIEDIREHRRERHWSREHEQIIRRRRSVSPTRSRERSRSPPIFSHSRKREDRGRSREHIWEEREDTREVRRQRHEEDTSRSFKHDKERSEHRASSRNGKPSRNDKYHWRKEENNHNHAGIHPVEEESNEGVHDLREIIKRSRDATRSPRNPQYGEEFVEGDEYFQEFVPSIDENRRSNTRWESNQDRGHDEFITFKKSIQNDIAQESGQFVSSKDSHPDIPFFDGNDQEITPRQFIKKIEDIGYATGWNSNELKCQMAAKLLAGAREWFLKDELMNEPWEKVKTQFIKMHPTDMDYFQQLKKMMDRTKYENESYSNYFTFKTMLMSAVGITGRRAVSCLIGGLLNPELESQCYQKNYATPELLFDYLNTRKSVPVQESSRKSSRYSPKKENHIPHKKPLLKTPKEPPILNNLIPKEEVHAVQDFTNEPFIIVKPEYEQKHLLTIKIRNHILDAYNDMTAQCVTLKEESAKHIHLEYSRRRTAIIGFRGVPVMALGDCEIRIGIDQATINSRVYIVPNICQEKPVVVGKTMREHQHLTYHESTNSISFKPRTTYPSTFSTNEKRKEKSNHIK